MIARIIEFSAKNKFLVLLFTLVAVITAIWCTQNVKLDAIPDLSDTQVIIYSRWDRSPDILEDQVTYPIIASLLGAPKVKAVRGFSDFGFSYVYVIFQDGTDLYWARSRVLEYLSKILPQLPEGVKTELGPDATSVGWVYQYALVDKTGNLDLAKLRSLQDWYLRYNLQSVPGVSEVTSIGGFVKQYQVNVLPNRLIQYRITLPQIIDAVRKGNSETGGRLIEFSNVEYMIRGKGYAKNIADLENIVVGMDPKTDIPILLKHVALVQVGPEIRRGVVDLDGEGDVVGGIVIMRHGENALSVINRVKAKLSELKPTLPEGVQIIETYDRSELIKKSIDTLKHTLIEEMIIVSLIILIFLWHIPSAIVPILTIPISVLLAFIPMYLMGLTSNIMSLAGIAISIGVLVDGAIVEVENAYKKLELWNSGGRVGDYHEVRLSALKEVGPSVFFSLLVIAVAFIPIFTLVDQEGRLFKPLAFSKTFAMAIAALLAVTLDPALRMLFTRMDPIKLSFPRKRESMDPPPKARLATKGGRLKHSGMTSNWVSKISNAVLVGKYYPEEKHPISSLLFKIYEPAARFVLRHRKSTLLAALILVLSTVPIFFKLGSEFMPPLNEGSILYMPTAFPGMSVTEAHRVLQIQDRMLRQFPEVERVFGKAGRAETPTDPAPFSMIETTVLLKPTNQWREMDRSVPTWFPEPVRNFVKLVFPKRRISYDELVGAMDAQIRLPGIPNIWTMPIKNRIDMLSTGIRTPIGIKVLGSDLSEIQKIGEHLEQILRTIPGTRNVYAERVADGYFLDFVIRRKQLAHYGLSVDDAQTMIMSAIGGENVTTIIEDRERYSVNVRFARDFRDEVSKLKQILVPVPTKAGNEYIVLAQIADIEFTKGPSMVRNENGMLGGYVYVDISGKDVGGYVETAKRQVSQELSLPKEYHLVWSGQYENMLRVKERLKIVLPITLFIICILLYLNTKSVIKTAIVLLAVPFSLIGAVWLLWMLGYNMSIAVWVGMIALMGLDAETGVFMLLFLDLSYEEAKAKGKLKTEKDLEEAIIHGAVKRVRPKMMTVMAAFMGLLPIMWSMGTGADMMKRIAAPMVGGLITSFILELLVYPVLYAVWKWHYELKAGQQVPA